MREGQASAPRAATRQPRCRAWLRIFVVRCGLPCDPPVGVIHAMQTWYHVSIAQSVKASRMNAPEDRLGSKPVSLEVSKCVPVCPRKRTSDVRVNEYTRSPGGLLLRTRSQRQAETAIDCPKWDTDHSGLIQHPSRSLKNFGAPRRVRGRSAGLSTLRLNARTRSGLIRELSRS
jgi:hypothetical protein